MQEHISNEFSSADHNNHLNKKKIGHVKAPAPITNMPSFYNHDDSISSTFAHLFDPSYMFKKISPPLIKPVINKHKSNGLYFEEMFNGNYDEKLETSADQNSKSLETSDEANKGPKELKYNHFYHNDLNNQLKLASLKCKYFESPISQSQIQYDCAAPIARNTPENNQVRIIEYRENKIASFTVDGKELLCLPQAFEIFLKNLVGGLHTVYTKLKRLDIIPIVCNVEQVSI
jgi:hypothetical protein